MNEQAQRLKRRAIPTALPVVDRSEIPAWLLSMLLHTVLLIVLAFLWTGSPSGTGGQRGGPVGIAVVVEQAGQESYFLSDSIAALDSTNSATTADLLAALPASGGSEATQAEVLQGLLPNLASGGSAAATGELGLGGGNAQLSTGGGSSKVKTSVFGVEGEGSRFVYVFDRSDSMNGFEGKPLLRAKEELIRSLQSLGETHQFQLVFYNDHPLPFGGIQRPKLLRGEEQQKQQAIQFVQSITGYGGTNHLDALLMAINMNPDVIFFLTDADDNPGGNRVEKIIDRAQRAGATVHCIQFGTGNGGFGGNWIQELAEQTRGRFIYIDVSAF